MKLNRDSGLVKSGSRKVKREPELPDIEEAIEAKLGEIRTESLDITFGEIVNLHESREIIIDPDYQRFFRWSMKKRSQLVESILLELPIPQLFVIENNDGIYELIDGLQRVSSVIQFVDSRQIEINGETLSPLVLEGCDLIEELNGYTYEKLKLKYRLRIKRSTIRMTVIKRQSKSFLRYHMFQRLNTGGESLSPQELRNCNARMAGERGIEFYTFLQDMSDETAFRNCIETLSESEQSMRGAEELVLRFLALKNARELFKQNVRDWLDEYSEKVFLSEKPDKYNPIDYKQEKQDFKRLFDLLSKTMGRGAFVRYNKTHDPVGGLAPAYFEAVTMGVWEAIDHTEKLTIDNVKEAIISTVMSNEFRAVTGPAANTRLKLDERIRLVKSALLGKK